MEFKNYKMTCTKHGDHDPFKVDFVNDAERVSFGGCPMCLMDAAKPFLEEAGFRVLKLPDISARK